MEINFKGKVALVTGAGKGMFMNLPFFQLYFVCEQFNKFVSIGHLLPVAFLYDGEKKCANLSLSLQLFSDGTLTHKLGMRPTDLSWTVLIKIKQHRTYSLILYRSILSVIY